MLIFSIFHQGPILCIHHITFFVCVRVLKANTTFVLPTLVDSPSNKDREKNPACVRIDISFTLVPNGWKGDRSMITSVSRYRLTFVYDKIFGEKRSGETKELLNKDLFLCPLHPQNKIISAGYKSIGGSHFRAMCF